MTVHEGFLRSCERHPGKVALAQDGRRTTYREILLHSRRIRARLLRASVRPGDRVLLPLANSPEYVASLLAVLSAGAVAVPLPDPLPPRPFLAVMEDCLPSAVISATGPSCGIRELLPPRLADGWILAADDPADREGADVPEEAVVPASPAMILYTSGTTGAPKGVLLTHRNLFGNARSIIASLRLTGKDRTMVVLPFHYSYGNSLLTTHLLVGGSLVLENSFLYPNRILERMVEEEVTGFAGVPSTFAMLLSRSTIRDFASPFLRYVTQAGGALPPRHAEELRRILSGKEFFIMYGQTEATARITCLDPSDRPRRPGSIGRAIPGVTVRLDREGTEVTEPWEEGEIVVQGENVMAGYWGDPVGSGRILRPDGLHTGDYACRDEDGFLYIVGRRSDFLKSGGHRIATGEIEELLCEIPSVAEAAVVGEADEILGEVPVAYLVLREGAPPDRNEVLGRLRAALPPYKLPRHVRFVPSLPKTPSGKIRKSSLSAGIAGETE